MSFEGQDISTFAESGGMTDEFQYARGARKRKRKAKRAAKKKKRKAKKANKRKKKANKKAAKNRKQEQEAAAAEREAAAADQQAAAAEQEAAAAEQEAAAAAEETPAPEAEAPAEEEPAEEAPAEGEEEAPAEEENAEGNLATSKGTGGSNFAATAMKYKMPVINFVLPVAGFGAGAMLGHRMGCKDGKTSLTCTVVGGLVGAAICAIPAIYIASTKKDAAK